MDDEQSAVDVSKFACLWFLCYVSVIFGISYSVGLMKIVLLLCVCMP